MQSDQLSKKEAYRKALLEFYDARKGQEFSERQVREVSRVKDEQTKESGFASFSTTNSMKVMFPGQPFSAKFFERQKSFADEKRSLTEKAQELIRQVRQDRERQAEFDLKNRNNPAAAAAEKEALAAQG